MVRAPSNLPIILMTGNLEVTTQTSKNTEKIFGKYGKNLLEFLGGDASFTRQD